MKRKISMLLAIVMLTITILPAVTVNAAGNEVTIKLVGENTDENNKIIKGEVSLDPTVGYAWNLKNKILACIDKEDTTNIKLKAGLFKDEVTATNAVQYFQEGKTIYVYFEKEDKLEEPKDPEDKPEEPKDPEENEKLVRIKLVGKNTDEKNKIINSEVKVDPTVSYVHITREIEKNLLMEDGTKPTYKAGNEILPEELNSYNVRRFIKEGSTVYVYFEKEDKLEEPKDPEDKPEEPKDPEENEKLVRIKLVGKNTDEKNKIINSEVKVDPTVSYIHITREIEKNLLMEDGTKLTYKAGNEILPEELNSYNVQRFIKEGSTVYVYFEKEDKLEEPKDPEDKPEDPKKPEDKPVEEENKEKVKVSFIVEGTSFENGLSEDLERNGIEVKKGTTIRELDELIKKDIRVNSKTYYYSYIHPNFMMYYGNDDKINEDTTIKIKFFEDRSQDSEASAIFIDEKDLEARDDDNELVIIKDSNLREWLQTSYGKKDITRRDMRRLKELSFAKCTVHDANEVKVLVHDLEGMQYAENIEKIRMRYSHVKDLSPLKDLKKLKDIRFRGNELTTAEPIRNVKSLEVFCVGVTGIFKDTTGLEDLENLKEIYVDGTGIDNLDFAKNLQKLEILNADASKVGSIEPVKDLKNLRILKVGGGQKISGHDDQVRIKDISSIENLKTLTELSISSHEIEDIRPLAKLEKLNKLNISNNNIKDFSPLLELDYLGELSIVNNDIPSNLNDSNTMEVYKKAKEFKRRIEESEDKEGLVEEYKELDPLAKVFMTEAYFNKLLGRENPVDPEDKPEEPKDPEDKPEEPKDPEDKPEENEKLVTIKLVGKNDDEKNKIINSEVKVDPTVSYAYIIKEIEKNLLLEDGTKIIYKGGYEFLPEELSPYNVQRFIGEGKTVYVYFEKEDEPEEPKDPEDKPEENEKLVTIKLVGKNDDEKNKIINSEVKVDPTVSYAYIIKEIEKNLLLEDGTKIIYKGGYEFLPEELSPYNVQRFIGEGKTVYVYFEKEDKPKDPEDKPEEPKDPEDKPEEPKDPEDKPVEKDFTDISKEYWGYKEIKKLQEEKIINGYLDGSLKPENSISRGEVASLLVKAFDLDKIDSKVSFKDVSKKDWYYDAVMKLASIGIIEGYEDGSFKGDQTITREELITILVRLKEYKTGKKIEEKAASFTDMDKVSTWARSYINKAQEGKIVQGYVNNTVKPKAETTRMEAFSMIYKAKMF